MRDSAKKLIAFQAYPNRKITLDAELAAPPTGDQFVINEDAFEPAPNP